MAGGRGPRGPGGNLGLWVQGLRSIRFRVGVCIVCNVLSGWVGSWRFRRLGVLGLRFKDSTKNYKGTIRVC